MSCTESAYSSLSIFTDVEAIRAPGFMAPRRAHGPLLASTRFIPHVAGSHNVQVLARGTIPGAEVLRLEEQPEDEDTAVLRAHPDLTVDVHALRVVEGDPVLRRQQLGEDRLVEGNRRSACAEM